MKSDSNNKEDSSKKDDDGESDYLSTTGLKLQKTVRFMAIFDICLIIISCNLAVYVILMIKHSSDAFVESFWGVVSQELDTQNIAFNCVVVFTTCVVAIHFGVILPLKGAMTMLRVSSIRTNKQLITVLENAKLWINSLSNIGSYMLISLELLLLFKLSYTYHSLVMILVATPRILASHFVKKYMKDLKDYMNLQNMMRQLFPS